MDDHQYGKHKFELREEPGKPGTIVRLDTGDIGQLSPTDQKRIAFAMPDWKRRLRIPQSSSLKWEKLLEQDWDTGIVLQVSSRCRFRRRASALAACLSIVVVRRAASRLMR